MIVGVLLFLFGCVPGKGFVSLPNYPQAGVEYHYLIKMPISATEAVIFWYYGSETRQNLLYSSGAVRLRTTTIRTEMYFPVPGRYILVVYSQTASGICKDRVIYHVYD